MFKKILIANRGEIACRVIRTAKKMGIRTVAVHSTADSQALHVQQADEAVHIGGSAPSDSYLSMHNIIKAAKNTSSEAIHPGYGFLSENPVFSKLCVTNNIVFIGPPTNAIEVMGSKSVAKTKMEKSGVPILPGYHSTNQTPSLLKDSAKQIGFPVLIKAVSGGGGKGMRLVHNEAEFDGALDATKREAIAAFGDSNILIEKYLAEPRHVEVQVFCDAFGNAVYLFERDCSIQRRHQKIIEEAPAPNLPETTREQMGNAAIRAAKAVNYIGAGTVEFLLDSTGNFYFMEMNTRLQVEHPVTEMITGQDLVEWQLTVAYGKPLPLQQSDLAIKGHAFEARIYAEDPNKEFLPSTGKITWLQQPPESSHVRVDTGVIEGDSIGVFYDPMIAKLIVWDENRNRALNRLTQALMGYRVVGVTTNIDFLLRLTSNKKFIALEINTDFIAKNKMSLFQATKPPIEVYAPLACLYLILRKHMRKKIVSDSTSPWHASDDWRLNASTSYQETIVVEEADLVIKATQNGPQSFNMGFDNTHCTVTGSLKGKHLIANINGYRRTAVVVEEGSSIIIFSDDSSFRFAPKIHYHDKELEEKDEGNFKAPMNGTVVEILVSKNELVSAGDTLIIMEAMKMEHALKAPVEGRVKEVFYKKGDLVEGGEDLLSFEALTDEAAPIKDNLDPKAKANNKPSF